MAETPDSEGSPLAPREEGRNLASQEASTPLAEREGYVARRGVALHWQILIGLCIGGLAGLLANAYAPRASDGGLNPTVKWIADNVAYLIGQVFLRLIFMVVIPLVVSALILGIVGIGDLRKLGALGLRTLLYTLVLSTASVLIGLGLANFVQPGTRLTEEKRAELKAQYGGTAAAAEIVEKARKQKSIRDFLLDLIPKNPLQEMVGALESNWTGGGMLAVMFFALAFGVAMTMAPERTRPLIAVLEGVYDTTMVIIGWAMRIAPLGVAALMFSLTAVLGLEILQTVALYVGTVLFGLTLHLLGTYSFVLAVFARVNPLRFFQRISEAMLTAFGTSSSNATLPVSLRVAQEKLGVRPTVGRFVLTIGSTANQNGTALYEGITVLFLAQVFGIELRWDQQIQVVLMCIMAGIGTAGVPGGSLPLVAAVLLTIGVPAEGIGIILGVDRILDMCRTTLNVTGDLVVAVCVDRSEGNLAG